MKPTLVQLKTRHAELIDEARKDPESDLKDEISDLEKKIEEEEKETTEQHAPKKRTKKRHAH